MNSNQLKEIALKIKKIGGEVQQHLGCGFDEAILQNALAIEFRKRKIEYLKEVNIEIFYKKESVGVDRPDFILTKVDTCRAPILLEMKVTDRLTDGHRAQLKSYCTSLPYNNNPALKDFAGGILMSFPQGDPGESGTMKICVVDPSFHVIHDDQALEDEKEEMEKARKKEEKKNKSKKHRST